jgi:hypothetical protein
MAILPNPFESAVEPAMVADAAAAPCPTDPTVAAADQFESRFVFDEDAFMNDIEPLPAFIAAPSRDYMRAVDIRPIVDILAEAIR